MDIIVTAPNIIMKYKIFKAVMRDYSYMNIETI